MMIFFLKDQPGRTPGFAEKKQTRTNYCQIDNEAVNVVFWVKHFINIYMVSYSNCIQTILGYFEKFQYCTCSRILRELIPGSQTLNKRA